MKGHSRNISCFQPVLERKVKKQKKTSVDLNITSNNDNNNNESLINFLYTDIAKINKSDFNILRQKPNQVVNRQSKSPMQHERSFTNLNTSFNQLNKKDRLDRLDKIERLDRLDRFRNQSNSKTRIPSKEKEENINKIDKTNKIIKVEKKKIQHNTDTNFKKDLSLINKKAVLIENMGKMNINTFFNSDKDKTNQSNQSNQTNQINQSNQANQANQTSQINQINSINYTITSEPESNSQLNISNNSNLSQSTKVKKAKISIVKDKTYETDKITSHSQELINKQSSKISEILKNNMIIKGVKQKNSNKDSRESHSKFSNSNNNLFLESHYCFEINPDINIVNNNLDDSNSLDVLGKVKSDEGEVLSNYFTLSKDYDISNDSESKYNTSNKKQNIFESMASYQNTGQTKSIKSDSSNPNYDSQEDSKNCKTTKEDSSKNSSVSSIKKNLESLEEAHFAFVLYMQQSRRLSTKEFDYDPNDLFNTVTHFEETDL